MKKDTLLSISEKTGFSISTVSRVLSGKGRQYRISQKTIDRVTEIAQLCNYTPNMIAQSLRTNKTNTIGLIVPNIDNPFFATLSAVIINQLKVRGYNILLTDTMENEDNEVQALNSFVSRNVDGIIAVPVGVSPTQLEETATHVPIVLIDRYFDETSLPYVCTDNYAGGYMATEYLINKGYRNLLALQGVRTSMPNKERLRGFLQAIKDYESVGVKGRVTGDSFSVDNGYNEAMQFLGRDGAPDAIFAFSTTILLGVLKAVKELGLRIPQDVALFSFDNNRFLDYFDPAVTRIEQPLNAIGKLATDSIIKMIEGGGDAELSTSQILIRPSLIEGQSC